MTVRNRFSVLLKMGLKLYTYCRVNKRPRLVPRPCLADVDTLVEVHGEGGLAGHRNVDGSHFDEEVLSQMLPLPDVYGALIQLELHQGVVVKPTGLDVQDFLAIWTS